MAAAPPIPWIQSCWKGLGGIRYGNIGVPILLGLQATSVSPFPDSRTPHCPLWGLQATSLSPSLWNSRSPQCPCSLRNSKTPQCPFGDSRSPQCPHPYRIPESPSCGPPGHLNVPVWNSRSPQRCHPCRIPGHLPAPIPVGFQATSGSRRLLRDIQVTLPFSGQFQSLENASQTGSPPLT